MRSRMDSSIEGPPDGGGTMTVNHFGHGAPWQSAQTPTSSAANSTLLFIAVEYVKDTNEYKFTPEVGYSPQGTPPCTDFEQHVSPLDPNMSSAACYSPSSPCTDADISYSNSTVVQRLISASSNQQLLNTATDAYVDNLPTTGASLEGLPTSLSSTDTNILKQVATNRYLLDQQSVPDSTPSSNVLQLVPESSAEQEVELLITDQATGISYNVSTQEYLVERCLSDDQQLLDALTPGPLLDSDLLALDDSALKSQLPDIVDSVNNTTALDAHPIVSNNALVPHSNETQNSPPPLIKMEFYDDEVADGLPQESLRRSQRQIELRSNDTEEQLLSQVRAITDKPVETRARATLPTSYLAIIKQGDGHYGVFARKMIPKRTQFGPLEGILVINQNELNNLDLHLLVECETGSVHRLDISDENIANWMCFVRKAKTYSQQNLLISQQGNSLYYTTTTNIWPKQELMVGYSMTYAKKHNLPLLQPVPQKENDWPCFECEKRFSSSDDLQKHLNVHDVKKEISKIKKKVLKSKKKKLKKRYQRHMLECKICKAAFFNPEYGSLKRHLLSHGINSCTSFEDKFNVISHNCEKCEATFEKEALVKIHSLRHKPNPAEMLPSLICPECDTDCPTPEQLIEHIDRHRTDKVPAIESKGGYKCPVCYKVFASHDRIQRHMLVHGSEESKPLKCDTCNKRFLNNSALACHLKTHSTDRKIFECPMCKETFDHVLHLKVHVPQHCQDGKYTCPHCQKVFKEYSIIRKHIRAFHCDRKHNCPHCGKPFPTLDKLRMHLLRHSDHREFLCADCGKQFKRKDKLKEHTKRMHSEERENTVPKPTKVNVQSKKFTPKVQPTDYHRFIYKCHACLVGFKRRGMLVNHLAKRHPDISPDSVPELNLPILRTTRDYYCQYCDKVYKSSSKRKAHILKNHPGQALPMSNRRQGSFPEVAGLPNPTFSQTVGSITTHPQACQWCHKQYASKAKLLQHQRKKHSELLQSQASQVKNEVHHNQAISQKEDVEEIFIDTHSFKRDFKVSDEELLSEVVALSDDRENKQYYHIISVPPNDPLSFNHSAELDHTSDSHLYRLLTTNGNGLLPPR